MKVLLINGSPNEKGCTYTALQEVKKTLNEEGVEADIFQIGKKAISGCIACRSCKKTGRCGIKDKVNEFLDKSVNYDGFIFGSPVHYAAASGALTSFMDRVFYAGSNSTENLFYLKPAASIVSARRAGTTSAFDQLNKYFTISQMPVISSQYWNMVHGTSPEEVEKDFEGMQVMRTLGRNMAWFLKCKEAGIKAGVQYPQREQKVHTNFISQ